MTRLIVCTGRNFISYKNDGSFFVPYLYFCFLSLVLKKTKQRTARCTACLYGMFSRITSSLKRN